MPEQAMAATGGLQDPGKSALAGANPEGWVVKESDRPLVTVVNTIEVFN